jgi:hypothetical protein
MLFNGYTDRRQKSHFIIKQYRRHLEVVVRGMKLEVDTTNYSGLL